MLVATIGNGWKLTIVCIAWCMKTRQKTEKLTLIGLDGSFLTKKLKIVQNSSLKGVGQVYTIKTEICQVM